MVSDSARKTTVWVVGGDEQTDTTLNPMLASIECDPHRLSRTRAAAHAPRTGGLRNLMLLDVHRPEVKRAEVLESVGQARDVRICRWGDFGRVN